MKMRFFILMQMNSFSQEYFVLHLVVGNGVFVALKLKQVFIITVCIS